MKVRRKSQLKKEEIEVSYEHYLAVKMKKVPLGSQYKTGQEAPESANFRCEQCVDAGKISDISVKAYEKLLQCSTCRADGRSSDTIWRLMRFI